MKPNIDITKKKERDKIVDLVMQGSATKIKIRDVDIATSTDAQKTEYIWFGKQMFEYLQVKGTDVKPETILFLSVTARQQAVVQKLRNFFGKWRQVKQKLPLPEMTVTWYVPSTFRSSSS